MKISRSRSSLAGGVCLVWLVVGCTTVSETGRKQLNWNSPEKEMQLGLTSFDQLKRETPIIRESPANTMLQRVGQRIAAVAPLPGAQWEFILFDSKEANAFCLPGGKVGVYTGILPITKDEAGLATVIGHEVAHAVARHGGERMSVEMARQALGMAVEAGTANTKYAAIYNQAYGLGSQLGASLPHSRLQESEADELGLFYMARAGYDPEQAVKFWERFGEFNKASGANTPWFLRTHPLDADRAARLKTLMPRAKQEYKPR
jgi:predicted Zn-dependent protease